MNTPSRKLPELLACSAEFTDAEGNRVHGPVEVEVASTFDRLRKEQDLDGDGRVSVLEEVRFPAARVFRCATKRRGIYGRLVGTYPISNLFQLLGEAHLSGRRIAQLSSSVLLTPPKTRLLNAIPGYMQNLKRTTFGEGLLHALPDEKLGDGEQRLFAPKNDTTAVKECEEFLQGMPNVKMELVPPIITEEWFAGLRGRHGLLTLAWKKAPGGGLAGIPYFTPGPRFNEMYGWDSFFMAFALGLEDQLNVLENLIYEIRYYGKTLNASRTWPLNRSQLSFFMALVLLIYRRYEGADKKRWLRHVLGWAVREYLVWMAPGRQVLGGLTRYWGFAAGPAPEVESGHYDWVHRSFAEAHGLDLREFERRVIARELVIPELDKFYVDDCAVRESGHDTTYRWGYEARCTDFCPVELNSAVFYFERTMAAVLESEFGGELELEDGTVIAAKWWRERARRRRALMRKYLFDPRSGQFYDFDLRNWRQNRYESAVGWFPLWASDPDDPELSLLTRDEAKALVDALLRKLLVNGVVAASTLESVLRAGGVPEGRQWDYPAAWAPHQMITWLGLRGFGFEQEAKELASAWLDLLVFNFAAHNGMVTEKYNAAEYSPNVAAEYGTVGASFKFYQNTGFGWTNASAHLAAQIC